MENENIKPNELTTEAQNTYPRSTMAENDDKIEDPTEEDPPKPPPDKKKKSSNSDDEDENNGNKSDDNSGLISAIKEAVVEGFREVNKKGDTENEITDPIEKAHSLASRYSREGGYEKVIEAMGRGETREMYFNSIFKILDSKPETFSQEVFGQLTESFAEYEKFIKTISDIANNAADSKLKAELSDDFRRYQKEYSARLVLHDLSAILYVPGIKPDQFFGFLEKFESSLGDIAFTTPGIREMMSIYESSMLESMALNDGYLDPEKLRGKVESYMQEEEKVNEDGTKSVVKKTAYSRVTEGEIEIKARERFKDLNKRRMILARTKDGKETPLRQLEDWEVDKLFNMARGMLIATERTITIAAESRLPKGSARNASSFLQDIVQSYSAFAHLNAKWYITGEALAAYLTEGTTKNQRFDNFLRRWNPKELKEMWDRFGDDPDKMLESLNKVFYLGRRNPNRAGDIWTWVSWRASEDHYVNSMISGFLQNGRDKMTGNEENKIVGRWDNLNPNAPKASEYKKFMDDPRYKFEELTDEQFFNLSKEKRDKYNEGKDELKKQREHDWAESHKGAPSIEEFEKFWDEYKNWTGTAFRFEKLRASLEKANNKEHEETQHGKDENKKAYDKAEKLIGRMVDLQPHRIFNASIHIRRRIFKQVYGTDKLDSAKKADFQRRLDDLALVESRFLNSREKLLDEGITFDKATLDRFYEEALTMDIIDEADNTVGVKPDEERIKRAKEFSKLVSDDHKNNRELYSEEFIYKREYTHGFALWCGDTPLDEYNASTVGATGGFVRRARDNGNQALAAAAESKLLDNLKNIKTPEQLIEGMEEIFASIDHYDRGKAQIAVAEKLEGILKFYKQDSLSRLPLDIGKLPFLAGRKDSFAKLMYGNAAPAWNTSTIRDVIEHFEHPGKITEEQAERLMKLVGASDVHMWQDLGIKGSQIILFMILLQMGSLFMKEIGEGVEEG